MSNYTITLVHKITKLKHYIHALDNHFAPRVYGYKLPDGRTVHKEKLEELYESAEE